jgi:uncharacterized delta-60 repeat protein
VTYPARIFLAVAVCVGSLRSSSAAAPIVSAGHVDASFTAQTQFDQSFSAIVIRPDQRIVAASGNRVQQFHLDGALDTNFTSIAFSNSITALALDSAGNIVVGADLYAITNTMRQRPSRLRPDGTFDRTFEAAHPMLEIRTIVLHPSGRIIYGGRVAGEGQSPIAALTVNGDADATYRLLPIVRVNGGVSQLLEDIVCDLELTDEGKLLLARGQGNIRSHTDGAYDTMFNSGMVTLSDYYWRTRPYAPAAALINGGVLFTGASEWLYPNTRRILARTLPDGSVDASFALDPSLSNRIDQVTALFVQSDGKTVFASLLRGYDDHRSLLARIDHTGRLDTNFLVSEFRGMVRDMRQDTTGGVLLAGSFTNIAGVARSGLARVHLDPPALPAISQQPASVVVSAGHDARLWVQATTTPDTRFQWHSGGGPIAAATNAVLRLADLRMSNAGDYFVTISNSFGIVTSAVATVTVNPRVIVPGALDVTFNSREACNNSARAIAPCRDGKLLVAGLFTVVDGIERSYVAKFHRTGELDTSFSPPTTPFTIVTCVVEGPEGEVYVGGSFTNFAGHPTHGVARLHPDGTLDTRFAAPIVWRSTNNIRQLLVTRDGKLYVVGDFAGVGTNTLQRGVVRLFPNGDVDEGFAPYWVAPQFQFEPINIQAAYLCADERLLVANRRTFQSASVFRLFASGAEDRSFAALPIDASAVIEQPDGKVLVCAWTGQRLRRFLANGQVDGAFTTNNPASSFLAATVRLNVDACGRAFVTGNSLNMGLIRDVLRFDLFGNVDGEWVAPTIDGRVRDATLLEDGTLAIAGDFATVNGASRGRVAVLHGDTYSPPAIIAQPAGSDVTEGESLRLSLGLACATPSPSITWFFNGTNIGTATTPDLLILSATRLEAGEYYAVVSNAFGVITSGVVRAGVAAVRSAVGTPNLRASSPLLSNALVNAILVQPDQRVLLFGSFSNTFGGANVTALRLDRRWGIDSSFELGSQPSPTVAIGAGLQRDGGILVSARMWSTRALLRRLRSDGSSDPTFPLFQYDHGDLNPGGAVYIDPAGNIVGRFMSTSAGRFSPTGVQLGGWGISSLDAIIPSGTNLIFGGRVGLLRTLNSWMSYDHAFQGRAGVFSNVFALAVQPDGRFLAAGSFTHAGGTNAGAIARFFPDGTLDPSFRAQPDGVESNFVVRAMVLQRDGKIIIGGSFKTYSGVPRNCLARLYPDGSLDSGFDPGSGPTGGVAPRIKALALAEDGTIYVGGAFTHFNGIPRHSFAALYNNPQLSSARHEQSFSASFVSVPDHTYILESAPSISASNWTQVESVIGDGTQKQVSDSSPASSHRFYRIRVE